MCVCTCVCVRAHTHTHTHTRSVVSLCDPVDSSLPGFSVQGIFQARILEWVAISISSFRGSSPPRDRTCVSSVSCVGRWALDHKRLQRLRSPTTYFSVSWRPGGTHSDSKGLSPGVLMSKGRRRWTSQLKWIQRKELAELLNMCVHTRAWSCLTATPWTAACQALLSTGFPR